MLRVVVLVFVFVLVLIFLSGCGAGKNSAEKVAERWLQKAIVTNDLLESQGLCQMDNWGRISQEVKMFQDPMLVGENVKPGSIHYDGGEIPDSAQLVDLPFTIYYEGDLSDEELRDTASVIFGVELITNHRDVMPVFAERGLAYVPNMPVDQTNDRIAQIVTQMITEKGPELGKLASKLFPDRRYRCQVQVVVTVAKQEDGNWLVSGFPGEQRVLIEKKIGTISLIGPKETTSTFYAFLPTYLAVFPGAVRFNATELAMRRYARELYGLPLTDLGGGQVKPQNQQAEEVHEDESWVGKNNPEPQHQVESQPKPEPQHQVESQPEPEPGPRVFHSGIMDTGMILCDHLENNQPIGTTDHFGKTRRMTILLMSPPTSQFDIVWFKNGEEIGRRSFAATNTDRHAYSTIDRTDIGDFEPDSYWITVQTPDGQVSDQAAFTVDG